MAILIEWEPLSVLRDDGLDGLVRAHWEEVGVRKEDMPLDCDWDKYEELERIGILKIMSARRFGKLIGYNSFMVMPHIHYRSTMHALGDAIYVEKEFRHTRAGLTLIEQAESDLARKFAPKKVRIVYHDKAVLNYLGPILKRRNYTHQENIWDIMVGGQ